MDILFSILIIAASILLILVVYIQNPKGGGLSSDFGAAQQIGGVQKTNDFIDKTTWSLAAIIMVSSIFLTIRSKSPDQKKIQEQQRKEAEKQQKEQKGSKPAAKPEAKPAK
ncbi:MAG: preprotein translocase subunit SecG [Crocinitomicaceae bacterium]|jgi:preprotein translocase subunit SecG|nr:preprotein translocase subunit SecG [Crocinitomicaceae bacterium]MCF8411398.1 preprotein translocase subunit SecG [Crocinitomicaceae bacterium]MCF8443827.1 preprotein translocase subunit SecG [Crocinitomicaceae bacterium]